MFMPVWTFPVTGETAMNAPEAELLDYETANAVLAWTTLAVLVVVVLGFTLSGEWLWAGLAASVVALGLVPPVASRRGREMLAWEVLVLAALPTVVRSFGLLTEWTPYVTVATLALVIVVELDTFTDVEMNSTFAVAFVVIVTMAVAGLWAIAQFTSDAFLGTTLLRGQTALMWNLITATVVGVGAGIVFEIYFRRMNANERIQRETWGAR